MEEMEYKSRETEREAEYENEGEGSRLSTLLDGARVVASAFALLRFAEHYIEPRRVLRYLGLYRRRSFWGSAALFGAGALAGAGIAMMVSPMSGSQTREGMMRGLRSIGRKGREMAQSAASRVQEGGEKQEQAGGREQGSRELPGPQGMRVGEQGGREQGGREQSGREQGNREQGSREQGSREQGAGAARGETPKALNR